MDSLSERALRYVDQLEAHMDDGGTTAPNNLRDLIQMIRDLAGQNTSLAYDLHAARKSVETKCGRCQQPIPQPYDVYRCTDCGMAMHRDCARAHFEESKPAQLRSTDGSGRCDRCDEDEVEFGTCRYCGFVHS